MRALTLGRPAPVPTLAERLGKASDRLEALVREAHDARRPHGRTEQLLDDIDALGRTLRAIARG
jgi:hypothetical protein